MSTAFLSPFDSLVVLSIGADPVLRRLGEADPAVGDIEDVDLTFTVLENAPVGTVVGRVVLSESPDPDFVIRVLMSLGLPAGLQWEESPDPSVMGSHPDALGGSVWRLVVIGDLTDGETGPLVLDADGEVRNIFVNIVNVPDNGKKGVYLSQGMSCPPGSGMGYSNARGEFH